MFLAKKMQKKLNIFQKSPYKAPEALFICTHFLSFCPFPQEKARKNQ